MIELQVEVLERDIEVGQPCSEEICPVALALYRTLGLDYHVYDGGIIRLPDAMGTVVYVNADSVLIESPEGSTDFRLPKAVSDIIYEYDSGNGMSPFGFIMASDADPGNGD